jgi:SAM-dependent methyltransferase
VGEDVYQNARYEDLRPVARDYITACHARVRRSLNPGGRLLLDAGSGPVQYPAYLEYSRGYDYRVCADVSITALQEAQQRLGDHGLCVVADIANLPFKSEAFDGMVSLHTIHHLPESEHLRAYGELYRVLAPGAKGVVVNGWAHSPWLQRWEPLVRFANRLRSLANRLLGRTSEDDEQAERRRAEKRQGKKGRGLEEGETPKGTFTNKHDAAWVRSEVGAQMPVRIGVWRTPSVRFMRALIHPWLGGRMWLRRLYRLEERYPEYYGENGKYPLIVIEKRQA